MNFYDLLTKIIALLKFDYTGWYPLVNDQVNLRNNQKYYDTNFTFSYDFKNKNTYGFNLRNFNFKCNKIRFNCTSNLSYYATTFKNYSSGNCLSSFEHYNIIPKYIYDDSFWVSKYLKKNDIWNISIESEIEFSVFNISYDDYYTYRFNPDYLRNIMQKNSIFNTKKYFNKWNIINDDQYVLLVKKIYYNDYSEINLKYNLVSDIQCLEPNQENFINCNNSKMSGNISYPNDSSGIIIYMDNFNEDIFSEKFECLNNDEL